MEELKTEIENIIGEDAYNEGAFMFDDNKMRFCFTPEELVKKRDAILSLIKERDEKYIKRIRGLKGIYPKDDFTRGYEHGLDDAIEQIKEESK